jgi:mono/diheme cytochrome c family protein
MSRERFALLVVIGIFVVLPGSLFGYQYGLRPTLHPEDVVVIDLTARLPNDGGWSEEAIMVQAGQRVRLRLTSDDVVHGFAIGQTTIGPVDVMPGEVVEIEFVVDEPGRYQFYCTRWCERDHWRMRGTLDVSAADGSLQATDSVPPPYELLGIDIDDRPLAAATPVDRPLARAGEAAGISLPDEWDSETLRAKTPVEAFHNLREDATYADLTNTELWNLVALAWRNTTSSDRLETGEVLFAQNCAACHGEAGQGNGPAARYLTDPPPADFTNSERMASASSVILHGKLVRGGMGTGMPYWGPIFTEEEQWALVDYLWSLWLDYA